MTENEYNALLDMFIRATSPDLAEGRKAYQNTMGLYDSRAKAYNEAERRTIEQRNKWFQDQTNGAEWEKLQELERLETKALNNLFNHNTVDEALSERLHSNIYKYPESSKLPLRWWDAYYRKGYYREPSSQEPIDDFLSPGQLPADVLDPRIPTNLMNKPAEAIRILRQAFGQ